MSESPLRRLPVGADVSRDGVHLRVWAPGHASVEVVFDEDGPAGELSTVALTRESGGYFSGEVPGARTGSRYRFRLDGADQLYPDPASRFQPEGPHGPSLVVDPAAFAWTDTGWPGVSLPGQVIYELHVGTFTPEGTWAAAAERLPDLAGIGITLIEVMPVAEFPGAFGWGYDGVDLFAPSHLYGTPDDLRRFVDRAHALGIGVILDVVYNHLGPDGNYLPAFSPDYFTDRYPNEWGAALNFDGPSSAPVREFFVANAAYWVEEFHLDGFRFDATQQIFDASPVHILAEIAEHARAAARQRRIVLIAENEPQETKLVRPRASGGYGLDALWNDDFHHAALVALTGRTEAYYSDYRGAPQEFIAAVKWGFLYQGQYYRWQEQPRGTPALDLPPPAFVTFLQNHDQVANSARGLRPNLLSSPGSYRALTALLLLAPGTPMLFQGQEFGVTTPFLYFADLPAELAAQVREGRAEFLSQFPSLAAPSVQRQLADPSDPATFARSKLDWSERERHPEALRLHRDLLALRRDIAAFRAQRPGGVDGEVLNLEAVLLRFFADDGDDRLLLVNLGRSLQLRSTPAPLLAPPTGRRWRVVWSSEDACYGGEGIPEIDTRAGWTLPARAALVLAPAPDEPANDEGA